jgi:hypothetical protein
MEYREGADMNEDDSGAEDFIDSCISSRRQRRQGGRKLREYQFLALADKFPDEPITPSSKLTALKETILRWQLEAPDDKIIGK